MKRFQYISLILLAFLTACEKPDKNISLHINTNFLEYMAQIEFIDAGNPNDFVDDVQIEILGDNADDILELGGTKNLSVLDGKIVLILNPRNRPEDGQAIHFSIKAEAPGYLPIHHQVAFQHQINDQLISFSMVKKLQPPTGVAHVSDNEFLLGSLVNRVDLRTPDTANKKTGARLRMSEGTRFFDANGSLINGDDLHIEMTHFDASGESSLQSFPGGFTPANVRMEDGSMQDIFFQTAGFVSIDMDVNGTAVKSFNEPIQLEIEIDPATINMNTNAPIQLGDIIPIWSYDVSTNQWQYEKTGTVSNRLGKMIVEFDVDHLSWWNLDFYGNTCSNTTVDVTINNPNQYESYYYELQFFPSGQTISSRTLQLRSGAQLRYLNAPNTPLVLKAYKIGNNWSNKGGILATSAPFNGCDGQGSIVINDNETSNSEVCVDIEVLCDSEVKIYPTASVYFKRPSDPNYQFLCFIRNGESCTSKIKTGELYQYLLTYNGREYKGEGIVSQNYYTIRTEIDCDDFDLE